MTTPAQPVFWPPLREFHANAGAAFAPWSGWMMPDHYGDSMAELEAIRSSLALGDISHYSRLLVSGTDALDVLRRAFAGHVEELEEGRALRTVSLDGAGRITDLVLIARTGGISYLVAGEPARRGATLERLQGSSEADWDVRIDDRTETTCLLALTGPEAAAAVTKYVSDSLAGRLRSMHASAFEFHGFRSLAVRASSTGEDGFLLMLAPAVALHLFETFRGAGAALAGCRTLDVARVEAAIPAWDPDLAPGLTPAQADLDALLGVEGGAEDSILAGLILDGDPVATTTAVTLAGERVGEVRSCVRSGTLGATIALAIVDSRHAVPGKDLDVGGGRATVVAKPFLRRRR